MTTIANRLKSVIKKTLQPTPKPITDFDYNSLPWIDKKAPDVSGFLSTYPRKNEPGYDLAEKLRFWQQKGYVILEQAIATTWLDQLWAETQEVLTHPADYKVNVRIDRPEYAANPVQEARQVPEAVLNGPYIKVMDFHNSSVAGKKIMLHPNIISFLEAVFAQKVVAMQSLLFKYGSQQATHQDFAYVVSGNPSHLAAAWIALEDVHITSGPLYYYPGSHTLKKFDFGNGIFFNGESTRTPNDFAVYLDAAAQAKGLSRETLLIKKGDVLLWHASLAHGGHPIQDENQTRKSFVCHYSSATAYKHHRLATGVDPVRYSYSGADVFAHPILTDQEDIFRTGDAW